MTYSLARIKTQLMILTFNVFAKVKYLVKAFTSQSVYAPKLVTYPFNHLRCTAPCHDKL